MISIVAIVQAVIISGLMSLASGFILLKVLETKINIMEKEVEKLKIGHIDQQSVLDRLQARQDVINKFYEEFRNEQKLENQMIREALNKNTAAIASLETLISRLEKKL